MIVIPQSTIPNMQLSAKLQLPENTICRLFKTCHWRISYCNQHLYYLIKVVILVVFLHFMLSAILRILMIIIMQSIMPESATNGLLCPLQTPLGLFTNTAFAIYKAATMQWWVKSWRLAMLLQQSCRQLHNKNITVPTTETICCSPRHFNIAPIRDSLSSFCEASWLH